jgi:single-strand DNA-binding protein
MANLNKVFLIGNLTRDPELRVTPKGTAVCSFGIAVNRVYRDEGGNTHEETTFVDIEAWGRQGETISKYLSKGRPVMIEGRLRFDSWESKSGEKRSKLKVVVDNFQFLGRGGGEGGSSEGEGQNVERHSPPPRAETNPAPAVASSPAAEDDLEDDVPF